MTDTFRIGECALVIEGAPFHWSMRRYIGDTVVIEGPLRFIPDHNRPQYIVRSLTDWSLFYAPQCCLQKLPPGPEPTDMLDTAQPTKRVKWSDVPAVARPRVPMVVPRVREKA